MVEHFSADGLVSFAQVENLKGSVSAIWKKIITSLETHIDQEFIDTDIGC
jgi:hypothetical protein